MRHNCLRGQIEAARGDNRDAQSAQIWKNLSSNAMGKEDGSSLTEENFETVKSCSHGGQRRFPKGCPRIRRGRLLQERRRVTKTFVEGEGQKLKNLPREEKGTRSGDMVGGS